MLAFQFQRPVKTFTQQFFQTFCWKTRVKMNRLLLIGILLFIISEVSSNQERFWHEEAFKSFDGKSTKRNDNSMESFLLFPHPKTCLKPQKELKGTKRSAKHFDGQWSEFLSRYLFSSGYELDDWERKKEQSDDRPLENAAFWGAFVEGLLLIPMFLLYIIFFLGTCFTTPIFGCVIFHIYKYIWWLISHPNIRVLFRRFWIANQKRKRQRMHLMYLWDKSKAPINRERLPKWLRKNKEEELPPELTIEQKQDSDEGESSDGFEVDYLHIGTQEQAPPASEDKVSKH